MFLVICCAANSPANSEESNDKHSSRDDRDYIDKMIELDMMGVLDDDDF